MSVEERLRRCRAWVFDLDGTLTRPTHDYDALRTLLALPPELGILEGLRSLTGERRRHAMEKLAAWEQDHALDARAASGAQDLLHGLRQRGVFIGILTRNRLHAAHVTLEAIGLRAHFRTEDVLSRECAPPKPEPDGIFRLLDAWGCAPEEAVMVGDHVHDLEAGRRAGAATVLIRPDRPAAWAPLADRWVTQLDTLLPLVLP